MTFGKRVNPVKYEVLNNTAVGKSTSRHVALAGVEKQRAINCNYI